MPINKRKTGGAGKPKTKRRTLDDLIASFPKGRSAAAKKIANKGVKSKGINIRAGKGNPAGKDLSIVGQIKRLMNPGPRNVGEPGLRQKGPRPPIKKIPSLNKKRSGGIINKVIGKRTPISGGRNRKDSARKTALGMGTTSKSTASERSFALKQGTRPGQKSAVQKDKARAAQRAGIRQDKFVGTRRQMSGGRGRRISGGKLPKKR